MATAIFAPVKSPVLHVGEAGGGALSAVINLVHIFPARDAECAGDEAEAVVVGVGGGAFKAHIKAGGAAGAAFRLVFQPARAVEPVVDIVVGVDEGDAAFLAESDIFLLADLVFGLRVDIGIVKEYGSGDIGGEQRVDDFAGAWRAT